MAALWDLLCYGLLGLLLLFPLLWKASSDVRYFTKIGLFYLSVAVEGVLLFPILLCRPRHPDNYAIVGGLAHYLLGWTRIRWELRGEENLEASDQAYVIVSNHQSSIDVQGMMVTKPKRCSALIKDSLLWLPWFGWAAWLAGSVFIQRSNTAKAKETLAKTLDYVKSNRLRLWVFPEGTRNHGQGFLPFKKGAFHLAVQAQIPIQPYVFSSYEPFYSKTERRFRLGGRVIVVALPPVPTKGLGEDDVTELSERVRDDMIRVYERISPEAAADQRWAEVEE